MHGWKCRVSAVFSIIIIIIAGGLSSAQRVPLSAQFDEINSLF
jgi:hypothetical protein